MVDFKYVEITDKGYAHPSDLRTKGNKKLCLENVKQTLDLTLSEEQKRYF